MYSVMAEYKLVWLVVILTAGCVVWQIDSVPVLARSQRSAQDRPNIRITHDDVPNIEQDVSIGGVEDSPGLDVNAASQSSQDDLLQSEEDPDQAQFQQASADTDPISGHDHADAFMDQDAAGSLSGSSDIQALSGTQRQIERDERLSLDHHESLPDQSSANVVDDDLDTGSDRDFDIGGHHEDRYQDQSASLQLGRASDEGDLDQYDKHNTTDDGHFLLTESETHSSNIDSERSSVNSVNNNGGFMFGGDHPSHIHEQNSSQRVTSPGISSGEQLNEKLETTTTNLDTHNESHSGDNVGLDHSEHVNNNGDSDLIHEHELGSGDQPQTGVEPIVGGRLRPNEGSGSHSGSDSDGGVAIDKDDGNRANHGGNSDNQRSSNTRITFSTTGMNLHSELVTPKLAILPTPAQIDSGETQTSTPHSITEGQGEGISSGDNPNELSGHSGDGPATHPERPGDGHLISGEGQIEASGEGHQGHDGVFEGSGTGVNGGQENNKESEKNEHKSSSSVFPYEPFPSIVPVQNSVSFSMSKITLFPSSSQHIEETVTTLALSTGTTSTNPLPAYEYVTTSYSPEWFSETDTLYNLETTQVTVPDYYQSSLPEMISVSPERTELPELIPTSKVSLKLSSSTESSMFLPVATSSTSTSVLSLNSESSYTLDILASSRPTISPTKSSSLTSTSSSLAQFTEMASLSSASEILPTSSVTLSTTTSQVVSPNASTTSTAESVHTVSPISTNNTLGTSTNRPLAKTTSTLSYSSVIARSTARFVTTTTMRSTTGSTTSVARSTDKSTSTSTTPGATVRISVLTFPTTKRETNPTTGSTTVLLGTTKKLVTHKPTEKPEEMTTTGQPSTPLQGPTGQPVSRSTTTTSPVPHLVTTLRPLTVNPTTVTVKPQGPPLTTPPPLFIQIVISMTWREFCSKKPYFIASVRETIRQEKQRPIRDEQIHITNVSKQYCSNAITAIEEMPRNTTVQMYLVDEAGKIDTQLTIDAYYVIGKGFQDTVFKDKIMEVRVIQVKSPVDQVPDSQTRSPQRESGITMVIIIASVGGLCCLMLIALQVILIHRRVKAKAMMRAAVKKSTRNNDNVALGAIPKSRPNSGYWNPALEEDDDIASLEYSHVLNYSALANVCMDKNSIYEEFQNIPCENSGLTKLFVGENDKNRFANVLPHSHSRVRLKMRAEDTSDYMNASYIKGYRGCTDTYIATQSPMVNTVEDFWRMVWEQQSRTIIMLNPTLPSGKFKQSTCYWPNSETTDSMRQYGDYTVALKKRDVQRDYIECVLEITDIERNLKRDVHHFLLTCWPDTGMPEPLSIVKFVLDTRPHYENSDAPPIIHCGPGTGRTGALIAIDICMRMYEARKHVDFLNCVTRMRKDRLGMVQSKEQYCLIYQALNEYAVILGSPTISTRSSVITLHAML